MTSETDLATRLEQAGPESQAELLREAFVAIFGREPDKVHNNEWWAWVNRMDPFDNMLDCGGYLSAAEMFVELGESYIIGKLKGDELAEAMLGSENKWHEAKTPALALTAACVRAILQRNEQ